MVGETKYSAYSVVNHIVSGAAVSGGQFSAASDVDTAVDNSTNLAPLCDIILTVAFGTAPTAGERLELYRQDLNIVSTNDEPDVDSSYKSKYMGAVVVDAVTSTQYLQLCGVPLPLTGCNFYIYNRTSQSLSSGWNLDVKPYTFAPAI